MRAMPFLAFAFAACSSAPPLVDGGEIRNETGGVLHRVQINLEPTKRIIFASQILPDHAFMLDFTPREMQSNRAELSWMTADGTKHSSNLTAPSIPSDMADKVLRVIFTIHANGRATIGVEPDLNMDQLPR